MTPLAIKAHCIAEDDVLYEHIRLALQRNLALMEEQDPHDRVAVLVGSGPSVETQLGVIRKHREAGDQIVAIKDAHDWLVDNAIIPDFAIAVDPQEHRWNCFKRPVPAVRYYIASQCHPAMFEHLKHFDVTLWHLYVREGQTYPPDSLLVTGGTTSGLRAITLFYAMGYRKFHLYGYDCCLTDNRLRVSEGKTDKRVVEVICAGKKFLTTPEMAAQANEFQSLFQVIPDAEIESHGEGIITTILHERMKFAGNNSASFIHYGTDDMASYRYRCRIPSEQLEIPTNNANAEILVFAKPQPHDVRLAMDAKLSGRKVVVDVCDDHLDEKHYQELLVLADAVTCPTEAMSERIKGAVVIPDPYEMPLRAPHCKGKNLLWFGHAVNYESIQRIREGLENLRVVTNVPGEIQWSRDIMPLEFARADIVLMPATSSYKSPNRTIEAIRQGCFVVAEPHPSINSFPGIWVGDIKEGIQWAIQNPRLANEKTQVAQMYVEKYAPERVGSAWKTLLMELSSTLGVERNSGTDGETSISKPPSAPTCDASPSRTNTHTSLYRFM